MNIPNMISLARIFLAPVFAVLYMHGRVLQAMAVLLLAAASDVLDGAIARHCHTVTDLGKVLDPIGDKLIQAAMMLCAVTRTPGVWLLLGLHVLREGTLSIVGLHVLRVTGHVYGARWYGKACTVVIYAVMMALLAFPRIPAAPAGMAVMVCAGFMGLCLCLYMMQFLRILQEHEQGRTEL